MAERALSAMVERACQRKAFGTVLARHQAIMHAIAHSRIDIEQSRLLLFDAARKIDLLGAKKAMKEIGMIKVSANINFNRSYKK
jgi:alkylation response protein AidB-like acyl-CoA dehydrogenase